MNGNLIPSYEDNVERVYLLYEDNEFDMGGNPNLISVHKTKESAEKAQSRSEEILYQ